MNQQEIKEYLRKNKTVAFGVPFIALVLLLDLLVLRPGREAKRQLAAGTTTSQPATSEAAGALTPEASAVSAPIAPPEPISKPVYPMLSEKIESRFAANQLYPYDDGRNVFIWPEKTGQIIVQTEEETPADVIIERPDITYHGFLTMGSDKVAILRFADELLLTRIGSTLKRTHFCLTGVFPDKIVISDTSDGIKDFEVALSSQAKDK